MPETKAPFMCECGASLCDERIWLSPTDYAGLDGPCLAPRHTLDEGNPLEQGRQRRKRRRRRS